MTTAFVLFPPVYLQRDAWFASSKPQLIAAYQDGRYSTMVNLNVGELTGEAAAEECFDLSNNPSRQYERDERWINDRSLSTGDIVKVDGEAWLCASMGWEKIA